MSMWCIGAAESGLVPGILLDRDGTIIEDYHYVGHVRRVQFKPGAIEAIQRFNKAGIPVAIITNQSGVARGFYSEGDVFKVHVYIEVQLALRGAHVDFITYDPYHPDGSVPGYSASSRNHKPNPGMAHQAADSLGLNLTQSIVVGDRKEDMELAREIGARAVYLGKTPLPMHMFGTVTNPKIRSFGSLGDAAGYIIERITDVDQREFPFMKYSTFNGFFDRYSNEIRMLMDKVDEHELSHAVGILQDAYARPVIIWVAGNGGAAAIANHMVADHTKHMSADENFETNIQSLAANQSVITAVANDIGYDAIFSWQLERYAKRGDILIVFSVSGNSLNIIRAVQYAKEHGINSIAFVGRDGGELFKIAQCPVLIPGGNYGVVEDVMSIIQHSMAQYIRQLRMGSDIEVKSARF